MDSKDLKYEQKIERLNQITDELKKADLPLDNLIALFEEGGNLYKECTDELQAYKLKVDELISKIEG